MLKVYIIIAWAVQLELFITIRDEKWKSSFTAWSYENIVYYMRDDNLLGYNILYYLGNRRAKRWLAFYLENLFVVSPGPHVREQMNNRVLNAQDLGKLSIL